MLLFVAHIQDRKTKQITAASLPAESVRRQVCCAAAERRVWTTCVYDVCVNDVCVRWMLSVQLKEDNSYILCFIQARLVLRQLNWLDLFWMLTVRCSYLLQSNGFICQEGSHLMSFPKLIMVSQIAWNDTRNGLKSSVLFIPSSPHPMRSHWKRPRIGCPFFKLVASNKLAPLNPDETMYSLGKTHKGRQTHCLVTCGHNRPVNCIIFGYL